MKRADNKSHKKTTCCWTWENCHPEQVLQAETIKFLTSHSFMNSGQQTAVFETRQEGVIRTNRPNSHFLSILKFDESLISCGS